MESVEIFCRNIISTGSAFGIRTDTGEQAFIPFSVVKASNIKEGETANATIAPNRHANEATPWFVIRINRDQPQQEPVTYAADRETAAPDKTIDDRALETVLSGLTPDVAAALLRSMKQDTVTAIRGYSKEPERMRLGKERAKQSKKGVIK